MNSKKILEKIFGNECIFVPRETNKKFIDANKKELYRITCVGYINKDDLNDLGDSQKYSEIHIVNR